MEQMLPDIEAFAHYMRGVITLFFVFECVHLSMYKRRNRMMRLLYYATLFLAFSHLKDAVFLFGAWKNSMVLNDLVRTFDMVFLPLICAFFLEAARPGLVTNKCLVWTVAVQAAFIPLFVIWHDEMVVYASMAVAFVISMVTIGYVLFFSAKYHAYIKANYSYYEHIDVRWVKVSCLAYFISLFAYSAAFDGTTWLSEALYNVFSLVLWTLLFLYARRHRVIKILMTKNNKVSQPSEACLESMPAEDASVQRRDEKLALRLRHYMETDKAYLNPKITLGDLAQAIGTNRTYLSEYFNHTLHTTFYDYINNYRVEEACAIMETMPMESAKLMKEVGMLSGFNSKATFNRYFVKVKGISPKSYYKTHKDSGL